MKESSPVHRFARMALATAALLVLAACSNGALPDVNEAPTLAPQASGSFSSGSLLRGSVVGTFGGVGVGGAQTWYALVMQAGGTTWFECLNNGGNSAPGQYDFTAASPTVGLTAYTNDKGQFENVVVTVEDDTDLAGACKNNWSLATTDVGGEQVPLTYQTVDWVEAKLYEVAFEGADPGPSDTPTDTIAWTCDDEERPTYPLEPGWEQKPLSEVCTIDSSVGGRGPKVR